jgi:diguanylate cyclase (GGDEF)-like protein
MPLFTKRFHIIGFMVGYVGFMYLLILAFPQYHELIVFSELIPPLLSSFLLVYVWYVRQDDFFWLLMGLGSVCFLVAQCILTFYDLSGYVPIPVPGLADVFWNLQTVFHISAFFYLLYKRKSMFTGLNFVFNTLIIGLVAGLLSWEFVVKPYLSVLMSENSPLAVASALIYPISDVVMTFFAFLIFFAYRDLIEAKVLMLMTSGFLLFVCADTFYFIQVALGEYTVGTWIDPIYSAALFVISLSGLYSRSSGVKIWKKEAKVHFVYLIIPYASLVLLLGVAICRMDTADSLMIGTTITILLIIVRQIIILLENDSLVGKLKEALLFMSHQADHDEMSKLPNRRLFERLLGEALQTNDRMCAVLFTDLDRFKDVNDSLGHAVGDQLIRQAAQRLQEVIGPAHTVARFGGDEFAILLELSSGREQALEISKQITQAFSQPFQNGNHNIQTSISIGVAIYPTDGSDVSELMKNADAAMYRTKEMGGNSYHFFNQELKERNSNKMSMERDLWRALDQGEFELYYQPQVEPSTRSIVGAEALVRWRRPDGIVISPALFIPLAEETGMIIRLGQWVLRTACEQALKRERQGHAPIQISVNVSPRQLQQEDFVDTVRTILVETGFHPARLVLEITEGVAIEQSAETIKKLHALKELGLQLSMDDFGTGYASIGYLQTFGLDSLKIAQTFIKEMTEKPEHTKVVQAIMAIASILNLKVIVEGVETEDQYAFFKNYDKCWIQGYYFYKPMPIGDLMQIHIKKVV